MRRREFLGALGGAATAWPVMARAQQSGPMRRIGVLIAIAESDPETQVRHAAFRQGLERLGWVEGRNIRIDSRFAAGKADQFHVLARELIALRPDVILAHTTPVAAALRQETSTIPIVFTVVSDPIGSGLIASLARPGGNITGLQLYEEGITGKWLGMLKEILPGLTRAALVANPKTTPYNYFLRTTRTAAISLGIELVPTPVENQADIERAIESFARIPNGGFILPPDTTTTIYRDLIVTLVARHRLPAVYGLRIFSDAGGLMSYGVNIADLFRQAAAHVDRVLRGEKPAEIPVQVPTKYETVVNLRTAKALGLTVPPGLLVAADEVIE